MSTAAPARLAPTARRPACSKRTFDQTGRLDCRLRHGRDTHRVPGRCRYEPGDAGATHWQVEVPVLRQLLRPADRRVAAILGLAGAILCAGVAPATAQSSQPAATIRYDDPVGNGIAIGAALGAIGGVVATGALYAHCHGLCDTPDEWPIYAMYGAAGAGAGAGVGWLIDKLHKGKKPAPFALAIRADRQERAVRVQWRL